MTEASFRAAIEKAQSEFIARIPARINAMRDHLAESMAGNREAQAALHNDFHALFGTASTYGYSDLGAAAASATRILSNLEELGWPCSNSETVPIQQAIANIERAFEACRHLRPDLGN